MVHRWWLQRGAGALHWRSPCVAGLTAGVRSATRDRGTARATGRGGPLARRPAGWRRRRITGARLRLGAGRVPGRPQSVPQTGRRPCAPHQTMRARRRECLLRARCERERKEHARPILLPSARDPPPPAHAPPPISPGSPTSPPTSPSAPLISLLPSAPTLLQTPLRAPCLPGSAPTQSAASASPPAGTGRSSPPPPCTRGRSARAW